MALKWFDESEICVNSVGIAMFSIVSLFNNIAFSTLWFVGSLFTLNQSIGTLKKIS